MIHPPPIDNMVIIGNVPNPNEAMKIAPSVADVVAADPNMAASTSPHGSSPLTSPMPKSAMVEFFCNNRCMEDRTGVVSLTSGAEGINDRCHINCMTAARIIRDPATMEMVCSYPARAIAPVPSPANAPSVA